MTIGEGCRLFLGATGTAFRTGIPALPGTFDVNELTVAAGGEITATHDLTGVNNRINIKVHVWTCGK